MPEPGKAAVSSRPLHFIWIIDKSGSMAVDGKMQSLNAAIKEAIPAMIEVANNNPYARMLVRTLTFATGVTWEQGEPTPVEDFRWTNIEAEPQGLTSMGAALTEVARELTPERLGERGYPPVLVLVTDGEASDNYKEGIKALMSTQWGKRAARVGIAIGDGSDHHAVAEFIGNPEVPVLKANNPQQLTTYIKWASATVSQAAAAPKSRTTADAPSAAGTDGGAAQADDFISIPDSSDVHVQMPATPAFASNDPNVW